MDIALWISTGILTAAYLAAGLVKVFGATDKIVKGLPWVVDYRARTVTFIGIAEVAGAIGIVLPWLTGLVPILTPLAALGLVAVQVLAIPVHVRRRETQTLAVNGVLLVLALFVAVGRTAQLFAAA